MQFVYSYQPQVIPQYWPQRRLLRIALDRYKLKALIDDMKYKLFMIIATHQKVSKLFLGMLLILVSPFVIYLYLNFTQWLWIAYGDYALMGWLSANGIALLVLEIKLWRR